MSDANTEAQHPRLEACVECGYCLLGKSGEFSCPECGVRYSDLSAIWYARRPWLWDMVLVLFAGMSALGLFDLAFGSRPEYLVVGRASTFLAMGIAVGFWWFRYRRGGRIFISVLPDAVYVRRSVLIRWTSKYTGAKLDGLTSLLRCDSEKQFVSRVVGSEVMLFTRAQTQEFVGVARKMFVSSQGAQERDK